MLSNVVIYLVIVILLPSSLFKYIPPLIEFLIFISAPKYSVLSY